MIYSPYVCFNHVRECLAIALFCVVTFPPFFFVTTYLLTCMAWDDLYGRINQAPKYWVFYTTYIRLLEKMSGKLPHILA